MERLTIPTVLGAFTARFSSVGLAALDFPGAGPGHRPGAALCDPSSPVGRHWGEVTRQALAAALAGQRPGKLPPLDLTSATPFQQAVWAALMAIPPGEVRTYAQVAASLARPRAARAVGAACGANPIPVLVPCHRVVAHGGLGGFSSGLAWKRRLLALERPHGEGETFC